MEEKNYPTTGIRIHDIIVRNQTQRTGEGGEKLGYSWYQKGVIGIVMQVNEEQIVLKTASGDEVIHNVKDEEKEYYYTLSSGSEIEYQNEIEKLIDDNRKKIIKIAEENEELRNWLYDFQHSISLLGKLSRFVKDFNK